MRVADLLHRAWGSGVAIDLGTVNTLVYSPGRGTLLDEPSMLALRTGNGEVVAAGTAAAALWGRSPEDVDIVTPLRDGVISDAETCSLMLSEFLRRAGYHHRFGRRPALVCVPASATDIERRALIEAVEDANPHLAVALVEEPVAAALGSGGDLAGGAVLVVDIGGGTTEMGVVVAGGVVRSRSIRTGGNDMDAAIVHAVRERLGLAIGERSAERAKIALGLAGTDVDSVTVTGVDVTRAHLRSAEVTADLVRKAVERSTSMVIEELDEMMAEVPPDLAEEILERGVYLAGGGALLPGLVARMRERTACPVTVVDDPLRCVLRGLARLLDDPSTERPAA